MFAPSSKTAIKALCSVGESFEQRMNASDTALHLVKSRIGIHMLVADRQPSRVAAAVRWCVMLSLELAMPIDVCPFRSSADNSCHCIVAQKYHRWLSITHIPCISVVQSNNVEYISRPTCRYAVLMILCIFFRILSSESHIFGDDVCDLDIVLYVLKMEEISGPTVACRLDSSEQPPFG